MRSRKGTGEGGGGAREGWTAGERTEGGTEGQRGAKGAKLE